jgi:rSAM/selenodomain-associated transferase 2
MTPGPAKPTISVVIPTLNEASLIGACLRSVRERLPDAEVLVVDGGSNDGTIEIALAHDVRVLRAPRGRGRQCNEGGYRATGTILMFLHADTTLPADAEGLINERFGRPGTQVAMFRLSFDDVHPLLRFSAFFTRFNSGWSGFGDQGIILRREVFWKTGGFRDWPFLEDVDLLQRLRMNMKIHILPAAVTTSARRFRADGYYRRQIRNGWILLRFFMGASPYELAREYVREGSPVRRLGSAESVRKNEPGVGTILSHPFHGKQ